MKPKIRWQTMETAPRDGTRVMLCVSKHNIFVGFMYRPNDINDHGVWVGDGFWRYDEEIKYWCPVEDILPEGMEA